MPTTVFAVGCLLGTEKYSLTYVLNMLLVGVGIATASCGACVRGEGPTPWGYAK